MKKLERRLKVGTIIGGLTNDSVVQGRPLHFYSLNGTKNRRGASFCWLYILEIIDIYTYTYKYCLLLKIEERWNLIFNLEIEITFCCLWKKKTISLCFHWLKNPSSKIIDHSHFRQITMLSLKVNRIRVHRFSRREGREGTLNKETREESLLTSSLYFFLLLLLSPLERATRVR